MIALGSPMPKIVAGMMAVFLVGTISMGQDADSITTMEMNNGRLWSAQADGWKVAYLASYRDQTAYAAIQSADGLKYLSTHWANKAIVADYTRELDTLYRDGENLRLPLPMAIEYCTLTLKGNLTKAQLEQILIEYRREIATW